MTKKPTLGRGLAALLDPQPVNVLRAVPVLPQPSSTDGIQHLNLSDLVPGKYQPRYQFNEKEMEELTSSIREKGVLQPLLVRPAPGVPYKFEIIAGERRWRAAGRANLTQVPVILKHFEDGEALEVSIIENIQRHDLNPLEEAEGYSRLIQEFHHTQEELAKIVGKSRPYVTNALRLMNLPSSVKDLIKSEKLTAGHGRALLGSLQPEILAEEIVKKGLSVRQTEQLVNAGQKDPKPRSQGLKAPRFLSGGGAKSEDQLYIEEKLTDSLEVPVTLEMQGEQGIVCLHYHSLDELDLLLQRLESTK